MVYVIIFITISTTVIKIIYQMIPMSLPHKAHLNYFNDLRIDFVGANTVPPMSIE